MSSLITNHRKCLNNFTADCNAAKVMAKSVPICILYLQFHNPLESIRYSSLIFTTHTVVALTNFQMTILI